MKLRKKIMIITGVTFFCAMIVVFALSYVIVLGSFARLEEQDVKTNIKRTTDAMAEELKGIGSIGGDWAAWNETRDFVTGKNEGYIEDNLTDEAVSNLNFNFMIYVNKLGEIVQIKHVNREEGIESPAPRSLLKYIEDNKSLLTHTHTRDSKSGVILLSEYPVLASFWPISNNDYSEPIVGTLVVGRYLDDAAIKGLEDRTHLSIEFVRYDTDGDSDDYARQSPNEAKGNRISIEKPDLSTIAGYTQLFGIDGSAALTLKVEMPRDIYTHGLISSYYFMWAILLICAVLMLVLLISLDKIVLNPITSLTRHVSFIAETDDLTSRLSMERPDEIGTLAGEFNAMVGELSDARKKLLDQSYKSGMAELASGVLHNVRNTLTPVAVEIESLCHEIRKVPIDQIEMARNELADGTPSNQRQQDLNKFLDVSTKGLSELVQNVQCRLDNISHPFAQIDQMLAGQDQFSHAEQPVETFRLDELINDTLSLLSGELKSCAGIECDSGLSELPQIKGHRISLVQILSNLLINACESIQQGQPNSGLVKIKAEIEQGDGVEMVHIQVCDNGEGIASENLERIFERGFTEKKGNHCGLGLHWCANTLCADDGKIYAESNGPGQGASLHVRFPRQVPSKVQGAI